MSFLDKKEQVLEIELTQYGKFLLSEGKFKPEFYAFFDSDVLYDGTYADVTEDQNSIEARIKATPRLMTQYNYSGVETENVKLISQIRNGDAPLDQDKVQTTKDRNFSLFGALGNSKSSTAYVPAWNVKYLAGEMTGASSTLTGSHSILQIPQLNSDLKFKYSVMQGDPSKETEEIFGEFVISKDGDVDYKFKTKQYDDGTYVENIVDFLLIEVSEANALNGRENFDIEVFEEYIDPDGKKTYTPLKFVAGDGNYDLDSRFAEYFINILVDDEIDKQVFCNFTEDRAIGVYDTRIHCEEEDKEKFKVYEKKRGDDSGDIC